MGQEHWSDYWAKGHLTSLPFDFAENYDHEIREFWFSVFDELPNEASILDVCTGNGALALLAAEYSSNQNKCFKITATDLAKIKFDLMAKRFPQYQHLMASITIVDEVALEDFPFSKAQYDLIMSQYGIEYASIDKVALPVTSALKPGGKLAILAHATGSDVIKTMQQEQQDYRVLESIQFFSRMKKMLRNHASQVELKPYMKEISHELSRTLLTRGSPVLRPLAESCQFVAMATSEQFKREQAKLFGFLTSLLHARKRLNDLMSVHEKMALNPDWFKAFEIESVSLQHQQPIVYKGKNPAGTGYRFKKSLAE